MYEKFKMHNAKHKHCSHFTKELKISNRKGKQIGLQDIISKDNWCWCKD